MKHHTAPTTVGREKKATREILLYLTTHVLRRQRVLLMKLRLPLEVVIGINRCFFCLCLALFVVGCSHGPDERVSKRERNYRKLSCLLHDYYTKKGRYPSSLIQLERYITAKGSQANDSAKESDDPQNILGITNPYNQRSGYGRAYADAWYFKALFDSKTQTPYFANCYRREILYHPANDFQGFVLYDCYGQEVGQRNSLFDSAHTLCYQEKCVHGSGFEYDIKTKSVHIYKSYFDKDYGKICK